MVRSGVVCGACRCWWLRGVTRGDEATTRIGPEPSCGSNIVGLDNEEDLGLPGVGRCLEPARDRLRYQVELTIIVSLTVKLSSGSDRWYR